MVASIPNGSMEIGSTKVAAAVASGCPSGRGMSARFTGAGFAGSRSGNGSSLESGLGGLGGTDSAGSFITTPHCKPRPQPHWVPEQGKFRARSLPWLTHWRITQLRVSRAGEKDSALHCQMYTTLSNVRCIVKCLLCSTGLEHRYIPLSARIDIRTRTCSGQKSTCMDECTLCPV